MGVLLVLFVCGIDRVAAQGSGSISEVAATEAQRRQHQVKSAQTLFASGSQAMLDKSFGEAMDYFKAAFELMPQAPIVADQRQMFFRQYQAASLSFAQVKTEEARWVEAQDVLQDVLTTAHQNSVGDEWIDPKVSKTLKELREHDDRFNQSLSPRHLKNLEQVNEKLILAKGYLELGEYDRAERVYHQVLSIDSYNKAARRGLENVERYRLDYYDVARDHTRAKMLSEVAAEWESPVPALISDDDLESGAADTAQGGKVQIERKLREIVIPSLEFNEARIEDVLTFLSLKSQELDHIAETPTDRGVAIVLNTAGAADAEQIPDTLVTVRLSNVPLESALDYVTRLARLRYRVDPFAVTVVSGEVDLDAALITRTFVVPSGFITGGSDSDAGGGAVVDPFEDTAPVESGLVKRITAKEFLAKRGVTFGEGASARMVAGSSTLVVRNTSDQIHFIARMVEAARAAGDKLVNIEVRTISISETKLKELGFDWLLGAANVGTGTPRVFVGGGTQGNAVPGTEASDFTFSQNGIPIGMNPVTSGLRSGNVSSTLSISEAINRSSAIANRGKSPGIFSVSGVFTDPQFQVVLRALNQNKGSDLLSSQHVVITPGERAKIESVREFIYPTEYDPPEIPNSTAGPSIIATGPLVVGGASATNSFPVTPATPTAFETRPLGAVLEIEPNIGGDNFTVSLNLSIDMSDFLGFINYGTPITNSSFIDIAGNPAVLTENEILMPVFDVIRETTQVDIWDGATIAIGGFHGEALLQSNDKVPGIGDLPFVGRAFRSSVTNSQKEAVLIFVTVNITDPGGNRINAPEEEPEPEFTRRETLSPYPAASGPPVGVYQAK